MLKDIMSTNLATVSPNTSLRDAAALLTTQHVSGMPVLSDSVVIADGKLAGIVTTSDIAHALADGLIG